MWRIPKKKKAQKDPGVIALSGNPLEPIMAPWLSDLVTLNLRGVLYFLRHFWLLSRYQGMFIFLTGHNQHAKEQYTASKKTWPIRFIRANHQKHWKTCQLLSRYILVLCLMWLVPLVLLSCGVFSLGYVSEFRQLLSILHEVF